MLIPSWVSFLIALGIILGLALSKKTELWASILLGALFLAIFAEISIWNSLRNVYLNLANLFLFIAVSLIPILGAIMSKSGMMVELVRNLDLPKKAKFILYPALIGLLPIPGGALFSAPLVDEIDTELSKDKKVAINVWYRHVLILVYPLSATLIVASEITGHSILMLVLVLTIPLVLMIIIGYITLLRNNLKKEKENGDMEAFFHNLKPIIIAPIIAITTEIILATDLVSQYDDQLIEGIRNFAFALGLFMSVVLAMKYAGYKRKQIPELAKEIKFWRFPLLISAMYFFLEVFGGSDVPEFIGNLNMSMALYIIIGFFLGFATGRVQLPISILFPIYMAQYAFNILPLFDFVLIYCAVFMGYICTPVHPCISLSIEYFETDFKQSGKPLFKPTIIGLGLIYIVYILSLII